MGLDIWFTENLMDALLAAEEACSSTARASGMEDCPGMQSYLAGYRAALSTIALAFGLSPEMLAGHRRELLEAGHTAGEAEEVADVVHVIPDRVWESNAGGLS